MLKLFIKSLKRRGTMLWITGKAVNEFIVGHGVWMWMCRGRRWRKQQLGKTERPISRAVFLPGLKDTWPSQKTRQKLFDFLFSKTIQPFPTLVYHLKLVVFCALDEFQWTKLEHWEAQEPPSLWPETWICNFTFGEFCIWRMFEKSGILGCPEQRISGTQVNQATGNIVHYSWK